MATMSGPKWAITQWQPWATLLAYGLKAYEFRPWPLPHRMVGEEIVIHASAQAVTINELDKLLNSDERLRASLAAGPDQIRQARGLLLSARKALAAGHGLPDILPRGAGVAVCRFERPRRCIDIVDLRALDITEVSASMWGWKIAEATPWSVPIPARGQTGVWDWQPAEWFGG